MIYIVASELRTYLAREPFAAKYGPIKEKVELTTYRNLTSIEFPPESTFLLCSVSSFSPAQHAIACQWEAEISAHREVRILNRPSLVRPWHEQMLLISEAVGAAAQVWPLANHFAEPRYPIMLRQQTSNYQVESPVLSSGDELNEIFDRMVMAGADPKAIYAVLTPESEGHPANSATTSLVKIGEAVFTIGDVPHPAAFSSMRDLVEKSPMDAAAFDFVLTAGDPCLWRIDDDLGRILPNLIQSPGLSRSASSDQALMAALVALDDRDSSSAGVSITLDPFLVKAVLTG